MIRIKYTKELLETNVKDCYSFAELCRRLGLKPEGSNPKTLRKKMDEFGVDYSHFTGQAWNKNPNNPVYKGKYLPKLCEHSSLSSANVKELVYRLGLKENKCEICGITEWQGKPIICELHHINGDSTDNRIENLQILCPNCHSQTDNFRSRNRSKKVLSAQEETLDVEAG
jgi:5-methylcytosine-specific restriction endonuclease McrA